MDKRSNNMTIWGVIMYLIYAYLVLGFIKFALMLSSAHVAAGVHMRIGARHGFNPSFLRCYLALLVTLAPIALIGWPRALWREKWSFFVAYNKRQVIRDVVCDYRQMEQK